MGGEWYIIARGRVSGDGEDGSETGLMMKKKEKKISDRNRCQPHKEESVSTMPLVLLSSVSELYLTIMRCFALSFILQCPRLATKSRLPCIIIHYD